MPGDVAGKTLDDSTVLTANEASHGQVPAEESGAGVFSELDFLCRDLDADRDRGARFFSVAELEDGGLMGEVMGGLWLLEGFQEGEFVRLGRAPRRPGHGEVTVSGMGLEPVAIQREAEDMILAVLAIIAGSVGELVVIEQVLRYAA